MYHFFQTSKYQDWCVFSGNWIHWIHFCESGFCGLSQERIRDDQLAVKHPKDLQIRPSCCCWRQYCCHSWDQPHCDHHSHLHVICNRAPGGPGCLTPWRRASGSSSCLTLSHSEKSVLVWRDCTDIRTGESTSRCLCVTTISAFYWYRSTSSGTFRC